LVFNPCPPNLIPYAGKSAFQAQEKKFPVHRRKQIIKMEYKLSLKYKSITMPGIFGSRATYLLEASATKNSITSLRNSELNKVQQNSRGFTV